MNLIDINGSDGPFWALYQAERVRWRIIDNPDYVPFWFLEKLAKERVSAARCALEKFGSTQSVKAGSALWDLERQFGAGLPLEDREQLVLGILGADEVDS